MFSISIDKTSQTETVFINFKSFDIFL
jgi:hypothetical protein